MSLLNVMGSGTSVGWSLGLHPRKQPGSLPGGSTKIKGEKDEYR